MPSGDASGSNGMMSPLDYQLSRDAHEYLIHSENSSKNYLFMEPVNLAFFPTYTNFVKRPMDLGTLRKNLDAGHYRNRDEFFNDAMLCFNNALAFHSGKKESQWIIKLSKDMMKLLSKQKKKADKRADKMMGGGGLSSSVKKKSKRDRSEGKDRKSEKSDKLPVRPPAINQDIEEKKEQRPMMAVKIKIGKKKKSSLSAGPVPTKKRQVTVDEEEGEIVEESGKSKSKVSVINIKTLASNNSTPTNSGTIPKTAALKKPSLL